MRCRQKWRAQQAGDVHRHLVGLLRLVVRRRTRRALLVVGAHLALHVVDGRRALDMALRLPDEERRGLQPVHRLEAYGRLPCIRLFPAPRLALSQVLVKILYDVVVCHLTMIARAPPPQIYRLYGCGQNIISAAPFLPIAPHGSMSCTSSTGLIIAMLLLPP